MINETANKTTGYGNFISEVKEMREFAVLISAYNNLLIHFKRCSQDIQKVNTIWK